MAALKNRTMRLGFELGVGEGTRKIAVWDWKLEFKARIKESSLEARILALRL